MVVGEGLLVPLVEVDSCVFDAEQFRLSHGFESLDVVAREAFVNHLQLSGEDRAEVAERVIRSWAAEMKARWPGRVFRIYRQVESEEVTIRFHTARPGLPNWCESGVEVIVVGN